MKSKFFIIIFLLLSISILYGTNPVKVIITAGQSNTDGRILNTDLPEYIAGISSKEYKYCKWSKGSSTELITGIFTSFWPSISNKNNPERWAYDAVTYYWLEQSLQDDFYVIKWSLGGTAIDTTVTSTNRYYWSADPLWLSKTSSTSTGGRSLLLSFEENIAACIDNSLSKLDRDYEIVAFLWHQGESDCKASELYYDNMKNMLEHVRLFLVNKTGKQKYNKLPFIYGTVSRENKRYNKQVEDAMFRISEEDKNCHIVDMSTGELQRDRLHFTRKSAEYLGLQMYNILVDIGVAGSGGKKIDMKTLYPE